MPILSQFLTKKSNPHLRQAIEFESGGAHGETKDNYHVVTEYREIIKQALEETSIGIYKGQSDQQASSTDLAE